MSDVLFFETPEAFHDWLLAHETEAQEVWVGYYKKHTGRQGMSWSASVDVALCFGWIDGIRKTVDADGYKIRFTPRKAKSVWSAVNVKKAKVLIAQGKMRPRGLELFQQRRDTHGYSAAQRNIPLAPAYAEQLQANAEAQRFFETLAPSYQRDSIWWVMSAKREATRLKRLEILIASAAAGLKIPHLRK